MTPELRFAIDLAALAIGFAFVLWGLRIFKTYVAVVGLLAGAGVGAAVGSVVIDADSCLLIGALAGGLIGALIAWPMQRLVAFLIAGLATALLAAMLSGSGPGSDSFLVALLIGFVVGGALGLILFERVVIAAMAFVGAQLIFHAAFVPNEVYANPTYDAVLFALFEAYGARLAAFAVLTASCVVLALWHQGPRTRKRKMDHRTRVLRRVPVGMALLILAANVAVALAAFGMGLDASVFELTGVHPLSWPFLSMATMLFLSLRSHDVGATESMRFSRRALGGYPVLVVFGVTVVPIGTALAFRAAGSSTWGLESYYRTFIHGAVPLLAAKWFVVLAWLPLVLYSALPKVGAVAAQPESGDADASGSAGPDGGSARPSPVAPREPAIPVDAATAT